MLQQSFPGVPVLVGRNRIQNAKQALQEHPIDVFVLDDGFQHWKLERDLDIVVIDCMNPFGNGCLIPRGILREPLKSLARADLFVLTKTDWGQENAAAIKKQLHSINPDAPVIETVHRPTALVDLCDPSLKESLEFLYPVSKNLQDFILGERGIIPRLSRIERKLDIANLMKRGIKGKEVAAFCAIGQPDSFARLLKSLGAQVVVFKAFGDHHLYGREDVLLLLDLCREKKVQTLVTTQKDAVKLTPFLNLFKDGFRLLNLQMEIQITKGREELCGRISRLLDR